LISSTLDEILIEIWFGLSMFIGPVTSSGDSISRIRPSIYRRRKSCASGSRRRKS
jgi:hypothetical protein